MSELVKLDMGRLGRINQVINLISKQVENEEGEFKSQDWIDFWKDVGKQQAETIRFLNNEDYLRGRRKENSAMFEDSTIFMDTLMTREAYRGRREELQKKIFDNRKEESNVIEKLEDKRMLACRNARDKIAIYTAQVEEEKVMTIRRLKNEMREVRRKYAEERAFIDGELKLLDAELKRAYYVELNKN